MIAKENITWSKLLQFNQKEIDGVSESAGVYRLSKKEGGKFYVFFVGSADNLKSKLQEHLHSTDTALGQYIDRSEVNFRYAIVADEKVRKAIEKKLYNHYAPELNLKEPESDLEIEVNLN